MKFGGNRALQGKQNRTQNKRHEHNNIKPQSKVIFWQQFFKLSGTGRCFLVESVFLPTKNSR